MITSPRTEAPACRDSLPPLNQQPPALYSGLFDATKALFLWCRGNQWAGYDPFDGLTSRLFAKTPLQRNRFCRLALIQSLKRLPINLRPLLLVPKEQNPKGIALFASASIKLARIGLAERREVEALLTRLLELRSPGRDSACWGYNFDWQTRTYLVPKFTPNIICTTFAANALLDAYDVDGRDVYLEHAISAGNYLLTSLNKTAGNGSFCFSYTPLDHSRIHNANLLGAALLARLYRHTRSEPFLSAAQQATRFSVELQKADGSWPYGEGPNQSWIDSFHTGYNLNALVMVRACIPESEWIDPSIKKGFEFFLQHFFAKGGIVKYYHDRTFPIDIHAIAQAIVTLVELRDRAERAISLAQQVCEWGLAHMRTSQGSFIYQRHRLYTNRITYMRWGQAWMLLAMSSLLEALESPSAHEETRPAVEAGSPGASTP